MSSINKMRVLVTGGSGFVGQAVIRCLLDRRCEIAALGSPAPSLMQLSDDITWIQGRLPLGAEAENQITRFKPDVCIHLAWNTTPGTYLEDDHNVDLLNSSLMLLRLLAQLGCPKVVMVGTCAEYNTNFGFLHEDTPTRPDTLYAASKLSLYLTGRQIAATARMKFVWARLFFVYGPHEHEGRMIPALVRSLLRRQPFSATLGEQVRDYLHVEDVAQALCLLALNNAEGVYNVASGVPLTIRQVMEMVGQLLDSAELIQFGALAYREWDPMFICGDNHKLRSTGWKPLYTLQSGMQQTIHWWREQLQNESSE